MHELQDIDETTRQCIAVAGQLRIAFFSRLDERFSTDAQESDSIAQLLPRAASCLIRDTWKTRAGKVNIEWLIVATTGWETLSDSIAHSFSVGSHGVRETRARTYV